MRPEDDEKGRKWAVCLIWIFRILRWTGYVTVLVLMSHAPDWAWGLLLAIILKRSYHVAVK